MKKLIIALASFLAFQVGMAQQYYIMNAVDAMEAYKRANQEKNEEAAERYLKEAKEAIDKATENQSTSGLSRTWKIQGDVYNQIFTSNNPRLLFLKDGSREKALDAYIKALTVQVKDNGKVVVEGKNDIVKNVDELINSYINSADKLIERNTNIQKANEGKEMDAEDVQQIKKNETDIIDFYEKGYFYSNAMFNAEDRYRTNWIGRRKFFVQSLVLRSSANSNGQILEKYGNIGIEQNSDTSWFYPILADYYAKIGAKDKQGAIIAKGKEKYPKSAEIYLQDVFFKLDNGQEAEAMQLLKEGKTKFPDQKAVLAIEEVNYYLGKGNFEKANKSLEEAIEIYANDPEDKKNGHEILKTLYFNAGVTYTTLADSAKKKNDTENYELYREKAVSYYQKTTELDPKYIKAYNQIAAMLVDEANVYTNEANRIPVERGRAEDKKKYDALITKANALYERAAAELEKAYAIEKTRFLRDNLMSVYVRLKNMKRLEELDKDQLDK